MAKKQVACRTKLDEEKLKYWRKVLPGVPDDEIVLPRYMAKDLGFPLASKVPEDASTWGALSRMLYSAIFLGVPVADRAAHVKTMRRLATKAKKSAFKWWGSLGEPTALKLNQSFYSRHGFWKDVGDIADLYISWCLCQAWFNLASDRRTAAEAKSRVAQLLEDAMVRWESGQ